MAVPGIGNDQPAAAGAAEDARFEVVRVLALPFSDEIGRQYILDALPGGRVDQRLVGALVDHAVMCSKGYISSLVFCEIKTHQTLLLEKTAYRPPDVYQVSKDVSGGLSQIQKTVSKTLGLISRQLYDLYEDDGTPTGVQVSTTRPRQVLVVGSLDEFGMGNAINPEKLTSFELYRNSIQDVEIITFDELYQQACFIVRDN